MQRAEQERRLWLERAERSWSNRCIAETDVPNVLPAAAEQPICQATQLEV